MASIKQIKFSTLHNCKVDYVLLDRLFDGHSNIATKKHVLEQVSILYNAESNMHYNMQLIINTLQHLHILVYVDDNDTPCDTTEELFDTTTVNIVNTNIGGTLNNLEEIEEIDQLDDFDRGEDDECIDVYDTTEDDIKGHIEEYVDNYIKTLNKL